MVNETQQTKDENVAYKKQENHGATLSLLAGFIIVLVIISVLAYKSGIDPKQLKADVEHFKTHITTLYKESGAEVNFNYSALDVEGGLFQKTITINQPQISVKSGDVHYVLSAPVAYMMPEDEHYEEFSLELASPVTVNYGNSNAEARFITEKVFRLAFLKDKEDGKYYYEMKLPESSSLEMDKQGRSLSYHLTLKGESYVAGSFALGNVEQYEFATQLANGELEHEAVVTRFNQASYSHSIDKATEYAEIHADTLYSDLVPKTLLPLTIDISQRGIKEAETGNRHVEIEQFVVNAEGAKLILEGNYTLPAAELLPFANIQVAFEGAQKVVDALSEANYIAPNVKKVILTAFSKIAPEWNAGNQSALEFAVIRNAKEPFMIGAVKADELFALVIREYLNINQQMMSPDAEEGSKEEPVEPLLQGTPVAPTEQQKQPEPVQEGNNQQDKEDVVKSDTTIDKTTKAYIGGVTEAAKEATDSVEEGAENVQQEAQEMLDALKDEVGEVKETVVDDNTGKAE